jgi:hypothetical protein
MYSTPRLSGLSLNQTHGTWNGEETATRPCTVLVPVPLSFQILHEEMPKRHLLVLQVNPLGEILHLRVKPKEEL